MHSKIHLLVVGLEQLVVGLGFDFGFGFDLAEVDLAEVVVVDFVVVVLIVVLKDEKQVDLVEKEAQWFLHEVGLIP